MALGNLSIKVNADIGGFTTNMDIASKSAQSSMGASAGSVDDFRASLLQASADMQKAALAMGGNMQAANDAIVSSSEKSVEAIQSISNTADQADFQSMGEKITYAIGAGVGAGVVAAHGAWEKFVEFTKVKAIVVGVAIGAIFAAVGLGAVYTAYKVISGSMGFITGLITGDSYKSESIDALIAANDQVKEIQNSLYLTAQQASATNAAIAAIGVNKQDYISVYEKAKIAMHSNVEELDRLGVKHKDEYELVQSANKVLNQYSEGWDRNQAAEAMGLGTSAQVAAAASVTKEKISEASARLNDYNLGIGEESQAAVKRYEDAMRDFNRETDLTSQGFKRAWADQIMPILTDFAEFFKEGFPFAVNAFRYSMATITSLFYGLKTVVYMVSESIVGSISAIGSALGGVATAGARAMTGDFSGAKDALISGWTDAKTRLGGIGDNIVAQARHNSDAMKQAWAMDDRNAPGIAKAKAGKTWKPADKKEEAAAAGPLDDVAKKVMEGKLKAQEDFIADEKTQLQTRAQFLQNYYASDSISAKDYYTTTQDLIRNNQSVVSDAYDKEIKAIQEYIKFHKTESDKKADIVAAENKITEIRRKKSQEEIATNRDLAMSYMALANERTSIANSLLKADAAENASYQHRTSVLTAFRDAQLQNAIEGNQLLEQENKRHADAMYQMQASNDLQALSQAASVGDQMLSVLKNAGQEKTALFKALFLANKAIAVAEILINTEVGAAKAVGDFGPFGIPMAAMIRGLGYASAGIVAGTAIAQASAEGGYDIPAGVNPVTQLHQKEMVLPAAQADVIRNLAGRSGGGGEGMKLTIVNNTRSPIGQVTEQRISTTERALIIQEAVAAGAAQFDDPNSRTSKAIGRNFSTQRTR